jgi:hypothetical protein
VHYSGLLLGAGHCTRRFPFPESSSDHDYPRTIEACLIRYLRLWRGDRDAVAEDGEAVGHALSRVLEWFICDCLEYSPDNDIGGWWCDGVMTLDVVQTGVESFQLSGVAWIGGVDAKSYGVAPFRIDAVLDPSQDDQLARCVFRIGWRDHRGRPRLDSPQIPPYRILAEQPRTNSDWAVAIELTPGAGC